MQAITVIELKGFTELSDSLAFKMDEVSLTTERVRVGTIDLVRNLIGKLKETFPTNEDHYIGGDTLFITFNDIDVAIEFSIFLLKGCLDLVNNKGLYYLKPSVCVGYGELKTQDARFFDNTSIKTYRAADKGYPFTLWVAGAEIVNHVKQSSKFIIEKFANEELVKLRWREYSAPDGLFSLPEINIPTLLLENEIIFSNSPEDAVSKIINYQNTAKSIYAFGGPIPSDIAYYSNYLNDTINLVTSDKTKNWNIISYLDFNDKKSCYYWLELARRLSILNPENYNFTAYIIPKNVLMPFSYQIYDEEIVHLGLRSYSLKLNRATMNASIIFKSKRIAERYTNEFIESYRKLGKFSDTDFTYLITKLGAIEGTIRKEGLELVEKLMKNISQ
ncbi:MAG: hypothetical protein WC836_15100 [Desulfobacula sp.]|jgi:hypothetical protein